MKNVRIKACNLFIWLFRPLSLPTEMLLHHEVGERYLGVGGVLAALLLYGIALSCPPDQSEGVWVFGVLFILRVIMKHISAANGRHHGGPRIHSRSPGRPLLGLFVPRISEKTILSIEWIVILLAGMAVSWLSGPLGAYLAASGTALMVVVSLREMIDHQKRLDRIDAEIEAEDEAAENQKRLQERYGREWESHRRSIDDAELIVDGRKYGMRLIESPAATT